MSTGSPYTAPQSPQGPIGGRGAVLLVGGIAFALVFLLIVGATVAFLVLRSPGGGGGGGGTASGTITETTTTRPPEITEPVTTTTVPDETTPITEEEMCWSPMNERSSQNPSGRLRAGGIEIVPPDGFDTRMNRTYLAFTTDAITASAPVEGDWVSSVGVGKIEWQPGVEYPGAKGASERLISCLFGAPIWGDTSQRTLHDQVTEAVTIGGMPGYRTTAVLKFGKHSFTKTDSTRLEVVVLETPEGPSVYNSEVAIGVPEHEQAAKDAYASLTGLSG